jgi:hypothetical protein
LCVTLVVEEGEPVGFLLIPKGRRQAVITIEEAEALQLLAGRIGALLAVSSALARSREREQEAQRRADQLQATSEQLAHDVATRKQSNRAFAELLARPVKTALYSAAARMTAAHIERANAVHKALVLEAPAGVDVVAWAAYAHTMNPTRTGPLVVLDAQSPHSEDGKSLTEHLASLLALPEDGTLLICGFESLTDGERELIERWLGHAGVRTPEAEQRLSLVLGVSPRFSRQLDEWLNRAVARGTLQHVRLPTLAERAEDLQALILETLTRLGAGPDGEPLGLEPALLKLLLDHDWVGNEAELHGVLTRAAARCRGTRITTEDLGEIAPAMKPYEVTAHATDLQFASASRRRHSPRKH